MVLDTKTVDVVLRGMTEVDPRDARIAVLTE